MKATLDEYIAIMSTDKQSALREAASPAVLVAMDEALESVDDPRRVELGWEGHRVVLYVDGVPWHRWHKTQKGPEPP